MSEAAQTWTAVGLVALALGLSLWRLWKRWRNQEHCSGCSHCNAGKSSRQGS